MGEKRAVIYARVSTHRQARDELPLDSLLGTRSLLWALPEELAA